MRYDAVVLAVGHSARDVYQMLLSHNVNLVPKDFAVSSLSYPVALQVLYFIPLRDYRKLAFYFLFLCKTASSAWHVMHVMLTVVLATLEELVLVMMTSDLGGLESY